MVRFARIVALDSAHHITQRGNARRFTLASDTERMVYLDLLQQGMQQHKVELIGYCFMSNHVRLVAVPQTRDALARSMKQTHGRFAGYWNAANHSSGHVWQGRYYSCPLDDPHLWEALRDTELNPVRASLVTAAQEWPWSSAAVHCGIQPASPWLAMDAWSRRWSPAEWQAYLTGAQDQHGVKATRDCTFSGRPPGSTEFTRTLETQVHRPLARQKPGPKKRSESQRQQPTLSFDTF